MDELSGTGRDLVKEFAFVSAKENPEEGGIGENI